MISTKFVTISNFGNQGSVMYSTKIYTDDSEYVITISGNKILLLVGVNYPDAINTFVLLLNDGLRRIYFIMKDWTIIPIHHELNDVNDIEKLSAYNYIINHKEVFKDFNSFEDMLEFAKL